MGYPKVLVGCPTASTHAYCLEEYAEAVKNLSYPNYDILIIDNSKGRDYFEKIKSIGLSVIKDEHIKEVRQRIVHSRNLIRQKVLEYGYDYFLSLEQDVIPPKNIIKQLLSNNKNILTAVYYNYFVRNGKQRLAPLLWVKSRNNPNEMVRVRQDIIDRGKLVEVDFCGLGCILIHKSVLEKVNFKCEEDKEGMDDIFFCTDAKNQGFKIFADTSAKCKHLVTNRPWKWSDLIDFTKFKK